MLITTTIEANITVYRTEIRGRTFEIFKSGDSWAVFAQGKSDPRPHYGKYFDTLADVEAAYKSLAGIEALITGDAIAA